MWLPLILENVSTVVEYSDIMLETEQNKDVTDPICIRKLRTLKLMKCLTHRRRNPRAHVSGSQEGIQDLKRTDIIITVSKEYCPQFYICWIDIFILNVDFDIPCI